LNGITITPIHLKREDDRIKKADLNSRNSASDDWGVDYSCFVKWNLEWKFTIDLFASSKSRRVERFYAAETLDTDLGHGALAVDAFCHSWDKEVAWVCPPVSQALRVIRRIKESKSCKGVLILPEWKSAGFWTKLFFNDHLLQPFYRVNFEKPYIVQFQNVSDTALYGITEFRLMFLSFETKE